jgi:hypothetical protein
MSMATIDAPAAAAETPALDVPTSGSQFGISEVWQAAADAYAADPSKRFYMYNGTRPASGSFATEDDGVALRELAWGQYKKGIDRWFYCSNSKYGDSIGKRPSEWSVFCAVLPLAARKRRFIGKSRRRLDNNGSY